MEFESLRHAKKLESELQELRREKLRLEEATPAVEAAFAETLANPEATAKQVEAARESLPKHMELLRTLDTQISGYEQAITKARAAALEPARAEFLKHFAGFERKLCDVLNATEKDDLRLSDVLKSAETIRGLWSEHAETRSAWRKEYKETIPVLGNALKELRKGSERVTRLAEAVCAFEREGSRQ